MRSHRRLATPRAPGSISPRQYARLLTDRTTGLPNYYTLAETFAARRRRGRPFAMFMLDIKGFGRYNERRRGHLRGNELLRNFALSLRRAIRAGDVLLRWSVGDEFVVLGDIASPSEVNAICGRLAGPHVVPWGRRTRTLSCYVAGAPVTARRTLKDIENVLHERLRIAKAAAKAVERS